jgi:hypothetical protein
VFSPGGAKLIATLAWTDPASELGQSTALVNDLDIRVVKTEGNVTNFPWKLASSNSANAIKGDNSVDNIEKVEIENAGGWYTITVSHKGNTLENPGTSFDDEQGNLPVPQQMYSLIVSGVDATVMSVDTVETTLFSVWPNPANDVLNISLTTGFENGSAATLYDVQGRVVMRSLLSGPENTLNIGHVAKGIYFVNVTNGKVSEVKKVIIK